MTLSGKTIWITGASSGIGEALAKRFSTENCKLILSARREAELNRVKQALIASGAIEANILVLPLDVTDYPAMPEAVEAAEAFANGVDMLVNNAGISQRSLCVDTDMDTYRTLFEVDVFGQIALTKALLPKMLARKAGHMVVISSVAGKVGAPYRTGYCAAKHAMMGFFDALRAENNHAGLSVTTVTPGFIRTDVSKNALQGDGKPFGKVDDDIAKGMDVDECADVIVSGIKANKPEIAVGKGKEMSALWVKRFFPKLLFKMAANIGKPS